MSNLQLTLAILKPHIVKNPFALTTIKQIISDNNFRIVRDAKIQLDEQMVSRFYEEHAKKFFFNRLNTFMRSGPIEVLVLAGDDAIQRWRTMMGPTKVFKTIFTHPDSIRGQFGISDTRNACHGSDSLESVVREVGIFFPDFNVENWLRQNRAKCTDNRRTC